MFCDCSGFGLGKGFELGVSGFGVEGFRGLGVWGFGGLGFRGSGFGVKALVFGVYEGKGISKGTLKSEIAGPFCGCLR